MLKFGIQHLATQRLNNAYLQARQKYNQAVTRTVLTRLCHLYHLPIYRQAIGISSAVWLTVWQVHRLALQVQFWYGGQAHFNLLKDIWLLLMLMILMVQALV
jgi:hypothetical protein